MLIYHLCITKGFNTALLDEGTNRAEEHVQQRRLRIHGNRVVRRRGREQAPSDVVGDLFQRLVGRRVAEQHEQAKLEPHTLDRVHGQAPEAVAHDTRDVFFVNHDVHGDRSRGTDTGLNPQS